MRHHFTNIATGLERVDADDRGEQRGPHDPAAPGPVPFVQRRDDAVRAVHPGEQVADGWLLVRNNAEGGPTRTGTGYYDDELVRTDQGWRIRRRVCRLLSWNGNPAVPEPKNEHQPDMAPNLLYRFAEQGDIVYLRAITRERAVSG